MKRLGYWEWKWAVESLLGKKLDYGETECGWSMYDRKLTPKSAVREFIHYMKGSQ
jgi:hypothetical protein